MEDLIGPVNGLDLVGWYDDLILTIRKSHSGRTKDMFLVVIREKAGWESV